MSYQQRQDHRDLYNQLRKRLLAPGESIAGKRRRYAPVNPTVPARAAARRAGVQAA